MERKIEITKCEDIGCRLNDRISIELSPSEVEDIMYVYEKKALDATSYVNQGYNREIHDMFRVAYNKWKSYREIYKK